VELFSSSSMLKPNRGSDNSGRPGGKPERCPDLAASERTRPHEELLRDTPSRFIGHFTAQPPRGRRRPGMKAIERPKYWPPCRWMNILWLLTQDGLSANEAIKKPA